MVLPIATLLDGAVEAFNTFHRISQPVVLGFDSFNDSNVTSNITDSNIVDARTRFAGAMLMTFTLGIPILFAILHSDIIDAIDRRLSHIIHQLRLGPLDFLILPGTYLFGYMVTLTSYPALYFFHSWDAFAFILVAGAIFQMLSRSMKMLFNRTRPNRLDCPPRMIYRHALEKGNDVHGVDIGAMPSSDTGCAAMVAGVLLAAGMPVFPTILIPVYAAFARMYWGYHWLGDTIVGTCVGLASAELADRMVGFGNVDFNVIGITVVMFFSYMKISGPANGKDPTSKAPELKTESSSTTSDPISTTSDPTLLGKTNYSPTGAIYSPYALQQKAHPLTR